MIEFIIFIFGLFFGSFFNVLADRLPRDETVIQGRSHCDHCKHTLSSWDLIPVLSFLYLRGKCRYCHVKLSSYYPFSELLTGVSFFLTYESIGIASLPYFIFSLFVISCLIVIFSADLKYGIIPDKIVYPFFIITFVFYLYFYQLSVLTYVFSAIGAGLFFLMLFFITRGRGMGFGDVKLAACMGMLLGFPHIVYALYVAFLTGAGVSLILILWKRKTLKSTIPFGPFLVFGTIILFLFPQIIEQIVKVVLP